MISKYLESIKLLALCLILKAKTETKSKFDFITQINEKWKKEQQCYDDAKVEGKDSRTGKKTTISWPRDKPVEQSSGNHGFRKSKTQIQASSTNRETRMVTQ